MIQEGRKLSMKIIACDDNEQILNQLKESIIKITFSYEEDISTTLFHDPIDLLASNIEADLLFLDIEMPQMNGLEVAKILRNNHYEGKIIFLTNYREFVQEGYKVQAFRYLYKPIDLQELQEIIEYELKEREDKKGVLFVDEISKEEIFLKYKHISFVESLGNKVVIYKNHNYYIVNKVYYKFIEELDSRFCESHRNFCVNMHEIDRINYTDRVITMKSGKEIPVSKRRKKEVQERYHHHMMMFIRK